MFISKLDEYTYLILGPISLIACLIIIIGFIKGKDSNFIIKLYN